jgi:hypothetical protein
MKNAHRAAAMALTVVAGGLVATAPAPAARPSALGTHGVRLQTIPATRGVRITLAGRRLVSGRDGSALATVNVRTGTPKNSEAAAPSKQTAAFGQMLVRGKRWPPGGVALRVYSSRLSDGGEARFGRYYYGGRIALAYFHRFTPRFQGPDGRPIDPALVDGYRLKSRTGAVIDVKGARSVVLQSSRVVPFSAKLVSKDIEWSLERVLIDGANVVNRAQNRFSPHRLHSRPYPVKLLFYPVRVSSVDAFFGFHVGARIKLRYPSGRIRHLSFRRKPDIVIPALPRGTYQVKAVASGLSPERPLAVSRGQVVRLKVISWLDVGLAGGLLGGLAVALLVARRPHLRRAPWRRPGVLEAEPLPSHPLGPNRVEPEAVHRR